MWRLTAPSMPARRPARLTSMHGKPATSSSVSCTPWAQPTAHGGRESGESNGAGGVAAAWRAAVGGRTHAVQVMLHPRQSLSPATKPRPCWRTRARSGALAAWLPIGAARLRRHGRALGAAVCHRRAARPRCRDTRVCAGCHWHSRGPHSLADPLLVRWRRTALAVAGCGGQVVRAPRGAAAVASHRAPAACRGSAPPAPAQARHASHTLPPRTAVHAPADARLHHRPKQCCLAPKPRSPTNLLRARVDLTLHEQLVARLRRTHARGDHAMMARRSNNPCERGARGGAPAPGQSPARRCR